MAIDQVVLEMTYQTKQKNLTVNRRIALGFRDAYLLEIFKHNIDFNKQFCDLLHSNQQISPIIYESLLINLEIMLKIYVFDFTSIYLNESLDEPTTVNVSLMNKIPIYFGIHT